MNDQVIKIKRTEVKSSNVLSLGYDDDESIMAIEMIDGHIYYYIDIPKKHFTEMIKCNKEGRGISSIGSYLHRNVKGYYRYVRVN